MSCPIWIRQESGIAFRDVPTFSGGRMPDFCIIGSAKCGTSALNAMLKQQPSFAMSPIKECHYFSTEAMLEKGDDWYKGLFHEALPGQVLGEASTSYTRYPLVKGTAERMAAANPNFKLIYLVREPVKRTESECLQTLKYARNVLGEDYTHLELDAYFDMIENDPLHPHHTAIFATSCYIDQIDAFDACFPSENLLILQQDDLHRDSNAVLTSICDFLGVDSREMVATESLQKNVTADWKKSLEREDAAAKFKSLPLYHLLKTFVPDRVKDRLLSVARSNGGSSKLTFSKEHRSKLTEAFREPNRRLEDRIGQLPDDWIV